MKHFYLRRLFILGSALPLALGVAQAQCPAAATCTPGPATNHQAAAFGMGILNVTIGSIDNTTAGNTDGYQDYSCTLGTVLSPGLTYPVSIRTNANADETVRIWIDFNNNGTFDPVTELFFSSTSARQHAGTSQPVPAGALLNQALRMRVAADAAVAPVPTPCSSPQYSQVEDYRVTLQPNTLPPVAAFTLNTAQACAGTFAFVDASQRGASGWQWNFGDGSTSTQQNPTHTYATPGSYTVRLRTCNAHGCDSTTVPADASAVAFYAQNPAAITRVPQTLNYCCGYGLTRVELGQDPSRNGAGMVSQASAPGSAGYQNYACVQRLSLAQGAPLALRLSGTPGLVQVFRAFLDLDNNGVFTSAEKLWEQTNSDHAATFLTLPGNAPVNQPLRLRLIADSNAGSPDPEADRDRGQVEDYSVLVTPAPCSGPLQAGQIVTVQQSASSYSYDDRAVYTVVGASVNASFQWQTSSYLSPSPAWVDIPGATQRHYTVDEPAGSGPFRQYRATMRCGAATATQLTPGSIRSGAVGRFHLQCPVSPGWHIQRVALLGTALNSVSDCDDRQGEGYSLYDPLEPGRTATLYRGEAYPLQVTTSEACRVTVFGQWYEGHQVVGELRPQRLSTLRQQPATLLLDLDSAQSISSGHPSAVLLLRVRCDSNVNDPSPAGQDNFVASGETEEYVLPVLPRTCLNPSGGLTGGIASGPAQAQCPTEALTASVMGHTPGSLLQWQVSADSTNWQDVTGQTARVLRLPVTVAGWYRVQVQGCAVLTYSVPVRVRSRSPLLCYTQPSTAALSATAARFSRVQLRGTRLDNATSATAGPAYVAYSPTVATNTATLVRGATYALDLELATTAGSPVTAAAWLDVDQNGQYDSLEWVHLVRAATPTTGTTTYYAELPISVRARPGTMGLRLRVTAGSAWTGAQAAANAAGPPAGETEDYVVTVVPAPCATAGNALTAGTIEWPQPATCLTLLRSRNYSLGADLQWQRSTDQGTNWTDVAGASADQYALPEGVRAVAVNYRLRARCGSSTAFSPPLTVPTGACQYSCLYDNRGGSNGQASTVYVDEVALSGTTLANYGSHLNWNPRPPYTTHLRRSPEVPAFTATLVRGGTYALLVSGSATAFALGGGVWADWNHDDDLAAAELIGLFNAPSGRASFALSVTVPATAALGPTLCRVRVGVGPFQAGEGCNALTASDAETEDYLLTVVAQPGPTLPSLTASLCGSAPLRLEATGAGAGATYTWLGPNGFVATGAVATLAAFSPSLAGTYIALAERNGQRVATSVYVPVAPGCLPTATLSSALKSLLTVYPNPTPGLSTLTWPEPVRPTRVLVRSITGQLVSAQAVMAAGARQCVLDLGQYPAGLYLVEMQTAQGSLFTKLIRQ